MTLGLAMSSRPLLAVSAGILTCAIALSPASATDGYFQYGYGARQKALGGAGVADSRDATAAALNPAGLVHAPTELTVSGTLFSPWREFSVSDPGGGSFDSKGNYFPVPNLAFTYRNHGLSFVDVIGVTVYGNGGMNTEYAGGASGAAGFGAGRLGIDLEQAFLSIAFAKTLAPGLSVGVAPILARQAIKIEGLQNFASPASSDPDHVTNQGTDVSWGGGVRAGIEWALAPQFRIGVAGNSRIYTHEFERYRGLFAEQGDFDIPASLQAGVAFDATPNLTLLADYKRIWYSTIASVSNPQTNFFTSQLGNANGAGFGWKDIDIIKVGAEWRNLGNLTLRAGYSYNTSPLQPRDVAFNILAPATVQHHITGGFEYVWSRDLSFEAAGAYVPEANISGSDFGGRTVELSMHQWEATVGLKYRFGQEPAPLK
jgi:long-chain fatty acid transport protein